MLHAPLLGHNGDIEGAAGADSTTNSAHYDDGDVVEGYVGGGFGDEHKGLVEAEEVALVGFDAAFYTGLLVVRDEVLGGRDDLLARQAAKDLCDDGVLGRFVAGLQFAFVFVFEEVSEWAISLDMFGYKGG